MHKGHYLLVKEPFTNSLEAYIRNIVKEIKEFKSILGEVDTQNNPIVERVVENIIKDAQSVLDCYLRAGL